MTQNRVVSTLGDISIDGKNYVANGDFKTWSLSGTSNGGNFADVWRQNNGSATGVVYSQASFTPGTAPVAGYEAQNYMTIAGTLTDSVNGWLQIDNYGILDVRTLAGQTVTLSFWAKGSVSGTISANFNQQFGTGGSSAVTITAQNFTVTTSWARYSATFSIPSISGATLGTGHFLRLIISKNQGTAYTSQWGTASLTGTLSLWGIQLEAGSTATGFSAGDSTPAIATDLIAASNNGPSKVGSVGWVGYQVAGKNADINGGMDIWQRGTSASIAASTSPSISTYGADRWQSSGTNANQAMTISRQATGDTTNLPHIQYCLRYQRTAGQTGTGYTGVTQSIETVNSIPFVGKTVTFSWYARAGANYSTSANALYMQVKTGTGTDQNVNGPFTGDAAPINGQITLSTTWQRFTSTVTLATNITQLGVTFVCNTNGTAGANDYFEVTGVQLELGSVATPFSRAQGTIQGELAACQRYYWRTTATTNAYGPITGAAGYGYAANTAMFVVQHPVPMRINPPGPLEYGGNVYVYNGLDNISGVAFTINTSTTFATNFIGTKTGAFGARYPYGLTAWNDVTAYLGISAEL